LKVSYIKAIFLTILAVATVIGFLLLVWYKKLRVLFWFGSCGFEEATHVFIEDELRNSDI
jgi:hypothetical protein